MQLQTIQTKETNTLTPNGNGENKIYFFDIDTYAIDTNPMSEETDVFYVNPDEKMVFHHIPDTTITLRNGFTGLEYLLVGDRVLPHFLNSIPHMTDTQKFRDELAKFLDEYNELVGHSAEALLNLSGSKGEASQKIRSVHQNTRAGINYYLHGLNELVNEAFKDCDVQSRRNRFWRRSLADLTKKQYSWIE